MHSLAQWNIFHPSPFKWSSRVNQLPMVWKIDWTKTYKSVTTVALMLASMLRFVVFPNAGAAIHTPCFWLFLWRCMWISSFADWKSVSVWLKRTVHTCYFWCKGGIWVKKTSVFQKGEVKNNLVSYCGHLSRTCATFWLLLDCPVDIIGAYLPLHVPQRGEHIVLPTMLLKVHKYVLK